MDWIYSYMDTIPKTELYDRDWGNNSRPISQLLTYVNSNMYYWINHIGHSTVVHSMGLNNHNVFNRWIAFETNLLGDPASELDTPYTSDADCNDCEINHEPPDNDNSGDGGAGGCFVNLLSY